MNFTQSRSDDGFDDEVAGPQELNPLHFNYSVHNIDDLDTSIPRPARRLTHSACDVVLGELMAGASEDLRRIVEFHQLAQPE